MKNLIVLALVTILMESCSEHHLFDESLNETCAPQSEQEASQTSILNSCLEKARWGDGNTFLDLAKCYHDGIGVKSDFMGTLTMLMMADQYGVADNCVEDYIMSLPDTDHTKMLFEAIAKLDKKNMLLTDSIVEILTSNGSSDGYALKGIIHVERGDTLGGLEAIQTGAKMGSSFAELLLCAFPTQETNYGKNVNLSMLQNMSNHSPVASKMLGDIYSGYINGETSVIDETLAASYYKKADEQGCLGRRPARWLINYYDRNGIKIDNKEMERLQILSGQIKAPNELISDSLCVDAE